MVLAPFFLALGAFGGGLFVASPCVGVFAFVFARRDVRRVSCGGVCVRADANGAAVCGNVRRRGVFVCQRAGGLRRRAPCVLRAAASARAAFCSVFSPSVHRPFYARQARARAQNAASSTGDAVIIPERPPLFP